MSYIREIRVEGDLVNAETLKFFDARTQEEIDDVISFTIRVYADGRYTMVDVQRPVGEKCPSASFWETWKLVGNAEATESGDFLLPHQKYFKDHKAPPVNFDPGVQQRPNEQWTPCDTCDDTREIVEFNLRKPCPDCTT